MDCINLDHAASGPLKAEVRQAMQPWLGECWGNPSSVHRMGLAAREAVDRARVQVARSVGAESNAVTFTGGGSEANNMAVMGLARARRRGGQHIVCGPTEHPSVQVAAMALEEEGFEVSFARLDAWGALDLEHFAGLLRESTVLVTQMLVNNIFGSIYPVAALARLVRQAAPQAVLHTDAVQALGKLDLRMAELCVDACTLSAHKIGGPKGVGALILAPGVNCAPLILGGGQESARRAGTENVAGLVGFGVAAAQAAAGQAENLERLNFLRGLLAEGLAGLGIETYEPGADSLQPSIMAVLVPGAPAEVWLHHLDALGVCVSTGSACQANTRDLPPALAAAGLDADRGRALLRFSLAPETTADEIELALTALREVSQGLAQL
jgi:cysteine desulfurase